VLDAGTRLVLAYAYREGRVIESMDVSNAFAARRSLPVVKTSTVVEKSPASTSSNASLLMPILEAASVRERPDPIPSCCS
jgi:hypothetical protein